MTYHDRDTSWFPAQCKPNNHCIAERNLARGKFTTQMRPLCPGYLFVAIDVRQRGGRVVNSSYGITCLVSLGSEPTSVPFDLVSQLTLRSDREGKLLSPRLLKRGDEVAITRWLVHGIRRHDREHRPRQGIWVLMKLMGAQKLVVVSATHMRHTR